MRKLRRVLKKSSIFRKFPKAWRDEAVTYLHQAFREVGLLPARRPANIVKGAVAGAITYAVVVGITWATVQWLS